MNSSKKRAREVEEQMHKLRAERDIMDHQNRSLLAQINEDLQQEINQFRSQTNQYRLELKQSNNELTKLKNDARSQQKEISILECNIRQLNNRLQEKEKEIESYNIIMAGKDNTNQQLMDKINALSELVMWFRKQFRNPLLNVYLPNESDDVDMALASVINNHPEKEKMKIMFLRESEGVYQFGQKRVHIKVEKGGQVFIRIGGGFMNVKDFIELITEQEVARIERKQDILERF